MSWYTSRAHSSQRRLGIIWQQMAWAGVIEIVNVLRHRLSMSPLTAGWRIREKERSDTWIILIARSLCFFFLLVWRRREDNRDKSVKLEIGIRGNSSHSRGLSSIRQSRWIIRIIEIYKSLQKFFLRKREFPVYWKQKLLDGSNFLFSQGNKTIWFTADKEIKNKSQRERPR